MIRWKKYADTYYLPMQRDNLTCMPDGDYSGDYYPAADVERLVEEIAQEAHTMGRIYERLLSPINPALEFNKVSEMAKHKLAALKGEP